MTTTTVSRPAPAKQRRPTSLRRKAVVLRWATLLILVALWELALAGHSSSYFATPSDILSSGAPYLSTPEALSGLWTTAAEFLIAFLIAAVAGIGLGVVLGLSRHLAGVSGHAAYLLYTLPQVPFYPLIILALGIGPPSEIAFGVTHGVLPVLLITVGAAARVDPNLLTAATSMGAGRWRRIRAIVLPAIVPDLLTALRVGASLTLVGVIIAQVLVSVNGVGGLISQLAGTLRPAELDAVVLAVCVSAVVLNAGLRFGERRLTKWRE